MEVRYAALGFLMQPYAGLAVRYVCPCGNGLAVLVTYLLAVKGRRKVIPQLPPVVHREIFGMFHCWAYLHTDDVVFYVGVVHGGELHFRPYSRSIHALRHEVVADTSNPFWMLLVPRFSRYIEHRPYAVGYRLCVGYHSTSSFVSWLVVPAG